MKFRLIFSLAICLLVYPWLTATWHIVASYQGYENNEFILSGFPLPYIVEKGIVGHFGNSMDTAVSYFNLVIDILFYWLLFFGLTFLAGKKIKSPTKNIKTTTWVLISFAVIFQGLYFFIVTAGDLHIWFENGYDIKSVEFL